MESCTNGSDFTILEEGVTARDVIDQKINEQMLMDNTDAFLVADLGDLVNRHLRWQRALPRVKPFYAVKCNSSKPVVQILAQMGTGFDCASKNEIALIQDIGVPAERIIYANPCKENSHIKYAASHGVQMMTFDNEDELPKVAMSHPTAKMVLRIATNDSKSDLPLTEKFGASINECNGLMEQAKALNVDITGVSFHVGSGCTDPNAFTQAIAEARLVFDIGTNLGFCMNFLDIGGGFPGSDGVKVLFEEITAVINPALDLYFPEESEVQIIAEPGRYYVASSFTLAVNIITRRIIKTAQSSSSDEETENKETIMYHLNDGVFGVLIIYSQMSGTVKPLLYKKYCPDQQLYNTRVWGPTLAEEDHISDQWKLPKLEIGDWLIFQNMGAYTISLSSNFNGFQRSHIHYVMSKVPWKTLQKIKTGNQAQGEEQEKPSIFNQLDSMQLFYIASDNLKNSLHIPVIPLLLVNSPAWSEICVGCNELVEDLHSRCHILILQNEQKFLKEAKPDLTTLAKGFCTAESIGMASFCTVSAYRFFEQQKWSHLDIQVWIHPENTKNACCDSTSYFRAVIIEQHIL
ncbi:antizyme inhibitor 2-like [Heterodontus francisci]|uniref:antizyme inhibitor 2-like n=1 Tax=Heterodontus francisci TaxID=7792 RepID=UPI00355BBBAE